MTINDNQCQPMSLHDNLRPEVTYLKCKETKGNSATQLKFASTSFESLLLSMTASILLFMCRFFTSMIFSIILPDILPWFDLSKIGFRILLFGAGLILLRLFIGACCICLQFAISFLEKVSECITFGRICSIEISGLILIIPSICRGGCLTKWFGLGVFSPFKNRYNRVYTVLGHVKILVHNNLHILQLQYRGPCSDYLR